MLDNFHHFWEKRCQFIETYLIIFDIRSLQTNQWKITWIRQPIFSVNPTFSCNGASRCSNVLKRQRRRRLMLPKDGRWSEIFPSIWGSLDWGHQVSEWKNQEEGGLRALECHGEQMWRVVGVKEMPEDSCWWQIWFSFRCVHFNCTSGWWCESWWWGCCGEGIRLKCGHLTWEHLKLDDRRSRLPNLRRCDKHLFQLSTHSELKSGFNETCLRNFSVRFLGWSTGSTCSRSVGYVRSTTSSNSSSSSIAERCGFAGTSDNIGHIDNTIHQLATGSDDCFYSWHVSTKV